MGEGEARWILESIGNAVHDLGHHGNGLDCPRSYAGRKQEVGKVDRS
jgi:hypothetical protein